MVKTSEKIDKSGKLHKVSSKHKVKKQAPESPSDIAPASPEPAVENESLKIELLDAGEHGLYDATEKIWRWNLDDDNRLTVKKFNGQIYVDVRKYWNGNPTKKGISLSTELFRKLQSWTGLNSAVEKISQEK